MSPWKTECPSVDSDRSALGDGRSGKLGDAVTLGEIISIGSNVDVALGVDVKVDVETGVVVCVRVGVGVIVELGVNVGVSVGVAVSVGVGVAVGLGVAVALAVSDGRGVGLCKPGKYGAGPGLPGVVVAKNDWPVAEFRTVVPEMTGRRAPCCQAGRTGVRVLGNATGFVGSSPPSSDWVASPLS